MRIKQKLKQLGQALTGYWFYKKKYLPRGTDLFWDIQRFWGTSHIHTVFDVGANIGQFCGQFYENFPNSLIHCFEPVSTTYSHLKELYESDSRVQCHKLAMGSRNELAKMFVDADSTQSSLLFHYDRYQEKTVKVTTVDSFCEQHSISTIDFMKVDTEGFDKKVLEGSVRMLKKQKIGLILLETELVKARMRYVSLQELHDFLSSFEYELIGIYNQCDHSDGNKSLLFVNALFARKGLAGA